MKPAAVYKTTSSSAKAGAMSSVTTLKSFSILDVGVGEPPAQPPLLLDR